MDEKEDRTARADTRIVPAGAAVKDGRLKKLFSVKTWVTLWAVGMVSYIVIANRAEFLIVAQWLCSVPLAYLGVNVWQKKIFSDNEKSWEKKDFNAEG